MHETNEDFEIEISSEKTEEFHELPEETVVIPIVNTPIFPGMIAPIILAEDRYTRDLEDYISDTGHVALNLVKYRQEHQAKNKSASRPKTMGDVEKVTNRDVYPVGIICKVVKRIKLPDGQMNILVHGLKRYRAKRIQHEGSILKTNVQTFIDIDNTSDPELDAYTRSVINQVKKLSEINPYFNEEMKLAMLNSPSPGSLADLVAFSLSLDVPEAQDFLETLSVKKRFAKLLVYLKREKDVADIQKKISDEVNDKVNKYQREYFLREQLKVIRSELGMDEDEKGRDTRKINEKLAKLKNISEDAKKAIDEELNRLSTIPESSPEYNVTRSYLNWLVDLPWDESKKDNISLSQAEKILEEDHFGMKEAKERVIEFLAVKKLKKDYRSAIICLAGPPGVGKTSLGKSVARAMNKDFYRFSLGGMRDEAEIKGHRRTYIGALPGKIIQGIKRVGTNNPVIMLDEIDKIGKSFQGDPASALLEVLDPEQNGSFIDHYLDVPFDLSRVTFIATANYIGDIPEPLLDRMELIEINGYTLEEKMTIAKNWILPKQLKQHGLKKADFSLTQTTLKKLISSYAREPGVRSLEQAIASVCRKAVIHKLKKRKTKFAPKPTDLEKLLGPERFESEIADKSLAPGVVTGLAWTYYGGSILYIETMRSNGKGFKLTGQLGDVMNESASIAYTYVKKLLQSEEKSKEENDFLSTNEVHLHLPEGATPKDGPSAGITMALALYSLAKNKKIRARLAMTGELSLTGKVHAVGGVKEKILAAKRAGIKEIILPWENKKNLKDVPKEHQKGMKFYPVKTFDEVLKIALKKK